MLLVCIFAVLRPNLACYNFGGQVEFLLGFVKLSRSVSNKENPKNKDEEVRYLF